MLFGELNHLLLV